MSITPDQSNPTTAYPPPPGVVPPPPATVSGLAVAGLIMAFIFAPIGFILSIFGLLSAGKPGKTGKGLAIGGLVVSLLVMAGVGVVFALVGPTVSKLADPGCTDGKAAITENVADGSDVVAYKASLQKSIDGLNAAAAKAKHDDVRDAMKAVADDYTQLIQAIDAGDTAKVGTLGDKVVADAEKVDSLCTIGGK
jgi:hypothetical protein